MKVLLAIFLLTYVAFGVDPQIWRSRAGETLVGDFLSVRPGKVYVRGKDEKVYGIPMAKLTDACLAEAAYLQEKLGEWALKQVDRQAMTESTANAVLMLKPHEFAGKNFLMVAPIWDIETGTKLKPARGPRVQFKTKTGIPFHCDFLERGELVVKKAAVYADAPKGVEFLSSVNASQLIANRQIVAVPMKLERGKFTGGHIAKDETLKLAQEADGEVREYEEELLYLRIGIFEEQIKTGASLKASEPLLGLDGEPLVIPPHTFSAAELEEMNQEYAWLKLQAESELPTLRKR